MPINDEYFELGYAIWLLSFINFFCIKYKPPNQPWFPIEGLLYLDPSASKREELLKRRKKQGSGNKAESSIIGGQAEVLTKEALEQATMMRSQIHLFWGNMLFGTT